MTEEKDLHLEDEERENSEDTSSEFDELFSEESEESNEDAPVTREEFNNLVKGVKNLATEKGRENKKVTKTEDENGEETTKVVQPQVDTDDVSELFFAQVPQAELVQDDLQTIAEAKYNGSILKAWRGEKWLQEKATAKNDAKVQEEKDKAKIEKPSVGAGGTGKIDLNKVEEKDFSKLTAKQKIAWVDIQANKESMADND